MIERKARDSLAESLRQFASGAITNHEFEERAPAQSKCDPAIDQIFYGVAWPKYDDFREERMTGNTALTLGERKDIARCILFLKSDLEFRWPTRPLFQSWKNYLRALFRAKRDQKKELGDRRVWPFFTQEEYRTALQNPPYLKEK